MLLVMKLVWAALILFERMIKDVEKVKEGLETKYLSAKEYRFDLTKVWKTIVGKVTLFTMHMKGYSDRLCDSVKD